MRWKANWAETKQHFLDWWEGTGLVVGHWHPPAVLPPRVDAPWPEQPEDVRSRWTDAGFRARQARAHASRGWFGMDCMAMALTQLGPGSVATILGSEPGFSPGTVWYDPCWQAVENPESLPALRFDPANRWWQVHDRILAEARALAGDDYAVTIPDLVEGIDILASLRDSQVLLTDLVERPEWVEQKLAEINQAWFAIYDACAAHCRMNDGWTVFWAFMIAAPGRVAKVQCDAAAMFSPKMFKRFVVPQLAEQCAWLDRSMFHLDGSQCLCHLDHLLAIDDLDAIEWTPDPKVPPGADPHWYDLYRRIKAAGKSVQVLGVKPSQIAPLLDAIGPAGTYIVVEANDLPALEEAERIVAGYR
jgi:hypothetical protein